MAFANHIPETPGTTVTATPNTGLTNGEAVTVSGTGFPANAPIFIAECIQATGREICDQQSLGSTFTDSNGSFSTTVNVKSSIQEAGGQPIPCDSNCYIVATSSGVEGRRNHAHISFAGGGTTTTSTTIPGTTTTSSTTTTLPATTTTSSTTTTLPATTTTSSTTTTLPGTTTTSSTTTTLPGTTTTSSTTTTLPGTTTTSSTTTTLPGTTTTSSTLPGTTTTSSTTTTLPGTTTTSSTLPGTTTTSSTTPPVPPGSDICSRLLQQRAAVNAQINAVAAAVRQSLSGPQLAAVLARLEATRTQANTQIDVARTTAGCIPST